MLNSVLRYTVRNMELGKHSRLAWRWIAFRYTVTGDHSVQTGGRVDSFVQIIEVN